MRTQGCWMLFAALVAALLPLSALASDGAIEINQARALAGGVTPGDTPGFPVLIRAPGRYVLTGSLTVSDANTSAVAIQSDDVVLDLNGFRIAGGTTCTGFGVTLSCAPLGTGTAVSSFQHEGITIRNGTITGFASDGIALVSARNCTIEGLTIVANGQSGLSVRGRCELSGVILDRNGGHGIFQSDQLSERDTTVRESVISRNRGIGLLSTFAVGSHDRFALLRSVVQGNGLAGLSLQNQGTVRDCVIQGNGDVGIDLQEGNVRGNAVRSNLRGFLFGALVGYSHNTFSDHATASVGGVRIGDTNLCFENPGPFSFCP